MSRIGLIKIGFLLFAVAVIGRDVQLQVVSDPRLARLASRQFSTKLTVLPRRGLIFDRNGEGLAISLKVHSLFFRPEAMKKDMTAAERTRVIFNLARILRMPVNTIAAKARSDRGFVWVKRQLTEAEEQAIKDYNVLEYGDGVGLAEESKRFYPNKELASHVLGSVNVDGQGLEGLELQYDLILSGERARVASSRDARGRKIFRDDKGLLAFKDGQSLVLTIDNAIQYEAEKALRQTIDDQQAKAGTVIVAEVSSGEILALANYPTFNSNNPRNYGADSRRNRAITDTYEPGSTFKPFVVAMALEKGRAPKSGVYCEKGVFRVADRRITEAEVHEKFEWLTLGEVLKYSSNIGAAKLALELGSGGMGQLMDRLGVGKRTGIDLPGEVAGSAGKKELNSSVRLANVGFGHGFTVTPLQMLSYYLTLANGGYAVQPKLVKAVLGEDPDSLERGTIRWRLGQRFDSPRTRRIFSGQVASQVSAMLESVVQEKGTGVKAALEEWPVAGKTGTAQKVDPATRRYSKSKYIASFAGFAPAKAPKLVAIVVIDEPQKSIYASETAAPAFKNTMRAGLLRQRVPTSTEGNKGIQLSNRLALERLTAERFSATSKAPGGGGLSKADFKLELNERSQIKLPDLRGLTVREVIRILGAQQLDIEVDGTGLLEEQVPAPGHWLDQGSKVKLVFRENR